MRASASSVSVSLPRLIAVLALCVAAPAISGCTAYCPIDTTRESLLSEVQPGDRLKIKTYANKKLRMSVSAVEAGQIKGRENGDPRHPVWVGFGAVYALERECPPNTPESPRRR